MMIIAYIKEDSAKTGDDSSVEQMSANLPATNAVITTTTSATLLSTNTVTVSPEYIAEPVTNPPDIIMQCQQMTMPKKSVLTDFIECFSLYNNISLLFSVRKSSNAVPIIDGLKYVKLHLVRKL